MPDTLTSPTGAVHGVSWNIICDFDGTITPFDVTDAVLAKFAHPSWEAIEEDWVAGSISARECMDRQVKLVKASKDELDSFLDTIPIMEGFSDFVAFCLSRNLKIVVLSDGMDYSIKRILTKNGFGFIPVIANRVLFQGRSGYRLEFPYGMEGCGSGVCKCAAARALGGDTLLIGDGRSDCCLAGNVTFVMAREGKELLARCQTNGYSHMVWRDFFDVRASLETLLAALQAELAI